MNNNIFTNGNNQKRSKIKKNANNIISTTPNTKLSQYLERNKKINKSPINLLNKSQNISGEKPIIKSSQKKLISHLSKSNIYAQRINPTNNLKNIRYGNNLAVKMRQLPYNSKSMSKNNSLSYYCVNTNYNPSANNPNNTHITNITNITNINNNNIQNNINDFIKSQKFYQEKSNLSSINSNNLIKCYNKEYKSPIKKLKAYLTTEDILRPRNLKAATFYPYVITEESKKSIKELKNYKTKVINKGKLNGDLLSLKKFRTSSNAMLIPKNKSNIKINMTNCKSNPQTIGNINSVCIDNLSTDKTNSYCPVDPSSKIKIINEIKQLTNIKIMDKLNKLREIFSEAVELFIPKEAHNVFVLILKEFADIDKDFIDNIKHLKDMVDYLNKKIGELSKNNFDLHNKLRRKEKEYLFLKSKIESINTNKSKKEFKSLDKKLINDINNNVTQDLKSKIQIKNIVGKHNKNSASTNMPFRRDNIFFKQLNEKNIDDLDALYFYDKIELSNYYNNATSTNFQTRNSNKDEIIPRLNLNSNYLEKCKQKQLEKMNESNLTPFQKIAMQFDNIKE